MKTKRLLRMLSLLAFLLLFAPFYDSCNGHRMKMAEANAEAVADTTAIQVDSTEIDSTEIANVEVDTTTNSVDETPFYKKAYQFIDDEDSENAYEFAEMSIACILDFNYKEFKTDVKKKDGYKGIFFQLKNLCFVFIILITLLIALFSFRDNKNVYRFCVLNLMLLSLTVICIFVEGLFETIAQIKWGYYAFIIVNLLIFYYSKQDKIGDPNS